MIKLINHATDLVRKKALLVLQRIHQINPSLILDYNEKLRRGLCDKEPSVIGVSVNLYYEQIKLNPQPYKDSTSTFVLLLK